MKKIYKLPRKVKDEETGKDITLNKLEKYNYYSGDLNLKVGKLKKDQIKNGLVSIQKDNYAVFDATLIDKIEAFKRRAQVIVAKDAGAIIANTGINKQSVILEAGLGSGSLSAFLASIAKEVDTFDVNQDHIDVAKKNLGKLALKNININLQDITKVKLKKTYDVVILDLPNILEAVKNTKNHVKTGSFIVCYLPNINQVQELIVNLPEDVLAEKTLEIIEREWKITKNTSRPQTKDFSHTAFLVFLRKIY